MCTLEGSLHVLLLPMGIVEAVTVEKRGEFLNVTSKTSLKWLKSTILGSYVTKNARNL